MNAVKTPCCPYCHLPTNQLSLITNCISHEDDMGYHEWWTCKCGNSFEDDETVLCSSRGEVQVVSHPITQRPTIKPAHCECGHYAYPIVTGFWTSKQSLVGYYCMEHGYLTHDAIVYDKEEQ